MKPQGRKNVVAPSMKGMIRPRLDLSAVSALRKKGGIDKLTMWIPSICSAIINITIETAITRIEEKVREIFRLWPSQPSKNPKRL